MKRNLKEFRERILELDNYICVGCGRYGTSAHHIKYRSHGGNEDSGNGVLFCIDCDRKAHHGYTKDGNRVIPHRFVLDVLVGLPKPNRFTEAIKELHKTVERLEMGIRDRLRMFDWWFLGLVTMGMLLGYIVVSSL